jgi:hypothetical protein
VGANPLINTVSVRISSYTFHSMFPSVMGLVFADANGNIVFSDITATMRSPS